jgi:hypothetical protein
VNWKLVQSIGNVMLPMLGRGDPRWHFHLLWVNRVLTATTRPMTSTPFRSLQLRMEAGERGSGTRVNDSSRGSNSHQPQKSASRVLRTIQTRILPTGLFNASSQLIPWYWLAWTRAHVEVLRNSGVRPCCMRTMILSARSAALT